MCFRQAAVGFDYLLQIYGTTGTQNFGAPLALWNEQSSEHWQSRALLLVPQSGLAAELSALTHREIAEFVGFKSMP